MCLVVGAELEPAFTHFTSDATTALAAPVTEVAFYTVPDSVREQAKAMIEEMSVSSTHPVITVGKSSGGAVGWGECDLTPYIALLFRPSTSDRLYSIQDPKCGRYGI